MEASTSSGLTALDILKRQRDALEEEIRNRQRSLDQAAKRKGVDPTSSRDAHQSDMHPMDRPAAIRYDWEENRDLSTQQFYAKYFDKGMPEGLELVATGSGARGMLEKLS